MNSYIIIFDFDNIILFEISQVFFLQRLVHWFYFVGDENPSVRLIFAFFDGANHMNVV